MLSLLIFFFQLVFFAGLALYLHHLSERYGLVSVLFLLGGIVGILNIVELVTLSIDISDDIVLRPGGHVYVPIILLILLLVYVANGTRPSRILIGGIVGINVLVLIMLGFLVLYGNVISESSQINGLFYENDLLNAQFIRGVIASLIAFVGNMFVMIIAYQGIQNTFPKLPRFFTPGIALILGLWTDSMLYNIFAFAGTENFVLGVPSDAIMKTLAATILWGPLSYYLLYIAPKSQTYIGTENRETFEVLFGEPVSKLRIVQLQDELTVSRAIYEQMISNIEEVFWLVDFKSNRLVYMSPSVEKITGYTANDFYQNPLLIFSLIQGKRPNVDLNNLADTFENLSAVFQIKTKNGQLKWIRNRAFPIETADGTTIRFAGLAEDITVLRKSQEKALELAISEEKVRLLNDFIRDASHDLRTPLSAISLKLDLWDYADAEKQEDIKLTIRRAVNHLNQLIEDMFMLARIKGEEEPEYRLVSIRSLLSQTTDHCMHLAEQKDLTLSTDFNADDVMVNGEQDKLFRLFLNLTTNAIRYTEHGMVKISTSNTDDYVVIKIADTGVGIAEKDIPHIFNQFYRTDSAENSQTKGTGLGLAIAKAIVDKHAGTISVESTLNEGTTFIVKLPIAN